MYYIIYKTTNLINNKFYIGMHKTKDLDDGYLGSGKYLINSIKKYGIENFKREILFNFNTEEEMRNKEKELVTEEFLLENEGKTYNLLVGGKGGYSFINKNDIKDKTTYFGFEKNNASILGIKANEVKNDKFKNDIKWKEKYSKNLSKAMKKLYPLGTGPFKDKKHTKETIEKMKEKALCRGLGNENSQFGTCWVYNLILKQNKKIKNELLNSYIEQGWIRGRKINFL